MEIALKGKHALVGGSSRGIGLAIARQLARSGARVTLAARSEERLAALVAELGRETGLSHGYLAVDYTDLGTYRNRIEAFLREDPVDILVNNTQGPPAGTSLEMGPDDYQQAFELLYGAAYTLKFASKLRAERKAAHAAAVPRPRSSGRS